METTTIFYLFFAGAISISILFFAIRGASILHNNKSNERKLVFVIIETICELLFITVLPAVGIEMSNDKCDTHPFEIESIPTAYTLWIVFAVAYVVSKYLKKYLTPILITIVASALICGALFCVFICIHFLPMAIMVLFPGFGLLYISPFLCLYFLILEIIRLNNYLKERLLNNESTVLNRLNIFNKWLSNHYLSFTIALTAPLTLAIQTILYLFGQKPDSIISQFTDSCGYLLSKYQDCSCGGGHYLCSIAANGNKKLVKPTRFGVRANEKIIVNRQLLIANAFENWLEDYTPRFHKIVRRTYDAMGIPVNKWSKHKRFANILYVFMKPLEWLFLLWLYAFDKNPENRIAKQYLPKKELNQFLNSK